MKMLWHYLYSELFYAFSDHKSHKHIFTQRYLNLRQRRWMEYLEDYDFELYYHSEKANVIADAPTRKSHSSIASLVMYEWKMIGQIGECKVDLYESGDQASMCFIVVQLTLI